jgi:hypothetical protein
MLLGANTNHKKPPVMTKAIINEAIFFLFNASIVIDHHVNNLEPNE